MARKPTGGLRGRPRRNGSRDALIHAVVHWLLNDHALANKLVDQPGLDPGRNDALALGLNVVETFGSKWWRAVEMPIRSGRKLTTEKAGPFDSVYEIARLLLLRPNFSSPLASRLPPRYEQFLRVVDDAFMGEVTSGRLSGLAHACTFPGSPVALSASRIANIYDDEQARQKRTLYDCPYCGATHRLLDQLGDHLPCLYVGPSANQ